MERMIGRCAGLDVHQATVVGCVLINERGRRPRKELRTFGTMTHELEALREWLAAECVTHVGMESTGVYWRPVHAVLEEHFEVIVGNARHIHNVPGRKPAHGLDPRDRCEGRGMDCRVGMLWTDPPQLRATAAAP
jgi:transposase